MGKAKTRRPLRPSPPKKPSFSSSSLAPQVLEQAARGWLQSTGIADSASRPPHAATDHQLAEALTETLRQLRAEIADLRSRIDRLESR